MAKKKLRLTVDGQLFVAPIYELDRMVWQQENMGCPVCKLLSPMQPKVDVSQFMLDGSVNMHTVTQCRYCAATYALHYVITGEVEE